MEVRTHQPTPRQIEIMQLYVEGNSRQEIADKLGISLNTVKTHMNRLLMILSVDSIQRAIAKGIDEGWLP